MFTDGYLVVIKPGTHYRARTCNKTFFYWVTVTRVTLCQNFEGTTVTRQACNFNVSHCDRQISLISQSPPTMANIQVAAAAYIYMHCFTRIKRNKRRWWQSKLYNRRVEYSGRELLADMRFQEISGHYKNFTRMSSTDFENIINLVGPKIMKNYTHFRQAISVQENVALTLRF